MVLNKKFLFPLYIFFISACLVLVALRYTSIFIRAYTESRYFCGAYTNGAFEHFNPLRRIAAGQVPGRDFQVFHGIGLSYLHFLPYLLLGETFFASQLTKEFFPPIFFFIANYLFFYAISRKRASAFVFSTAVLLLAPRLYPNVLIPGGYLSFGVRTAFPIMISSIIILLRTSKRVSPTLVHFPGFHLLISFLLAVSFFISTDQGFVSLIAFPLALMLFDPESRLSYRLLTTILTIVFSAGWVFLVFFIAVGQHFLVPLTFYLREIPSDQFWFLGAPYQGFIRSLPDLVHYPYIVQVMIMGIFLFLTVSWLHLRRKVDGAESLGVLFLLIYGFFSMIPVLGYVDNAHAMPFARVEILVALWLFLRIPPRALTFIKKPISLFNAAIFLVALVFLGLFFTLASNGVADLSKASEGAKIKATYYQSKKMVSGVYLCDSGYINWQYHLDVLDKYIPQLKNSATNAPAPTLWSTFSGLPEFLLGQFNLASDYIDHALGPDRRERYVELFKETKPAFVITLRRKPFPDEWLQNHYWQFYKTILNNYEPVDVSLFGVIWKKTIDTWVDEEPRWEGTLTNLEDRPQIEIPLDAVTRQDIEVLDVKLTYGIRNPWRALPYVGLLSRYLLDIDNSNFNHETITNMPVSLAPYDTVKEFPIIVGPGVNPRLRLEVAPVLPGVSFSVKEIKYRVLKLSETKKRYFLDL